MSHRKVEIRFEEGDRPWRIYWSGTTELADERWFSTLEEAGPVARALMDPAPAFKLEKRDGGSSRLRRA